MTRSKYFENLEVKRNGTPSDCGTVELCRYTKFDDLLHGRGRKNPCSRLYCTLLKCPYFLLDLANSKNGVPFEEHGVPSYCSGLCMST